MNIILLIIYIATLIFLIVDFVQCLKNKLKWSRLFIFEAISIIVSAIFLIYYDNLPGNGFMPGLTYIGEVLFSFSAMVLYSVMLFITLIAKLTLCLLKGRRKK